MQGRGLGGNEGREEVIQQHIGAVGASVTTGSAFMGWVVAATPILQFTSLLVSTVAGVLTVVWYVRKLLRR